MLVLPSKLSPNPKPYFEEQHMKFFNSFVCFMLDAKLHLQNVSWKTKQSVMEMRL